MSAILQPHQLHEYQKRAVDHQCSLPETMMWLDMGLGKTAITLTSAAWLLQTGYLRAIVIVAPVRVCRLVWRQEAAKWAHTQHLSFSMLMGDKGTRTRNLLQPAQVYLINYENLGWLAQTLATYFISKCKPIPFDGLVLDEISKMKNSTTKRVESFMLIHNHFKWKTGLTGTPASNGYKDLHGQYLVIDGGKRLGKTKTKFKTMFFYKPAGGDAGPYAKELAFPDTETKIKELIGDITLEMSAEDYNPLPKLIVNDILIEMEGQLRANYEQLEQDFFFHLDAIDQDVEAFNKSALTNKCLQFSNGSIYPVSGDPHWEPIHDLKLEALEEIIDEAQGQPVLCSYTYRSDAERIMRKFASLDPINLTECKSESALKNAMARWKTGNCQLMIGHPACVHPRTQVLTELRGWVRIVDVKPDERVFDGVEFVSHGGCSCSGYKDVVDVLGFTMTPDHKLWVGDEWRTANDVRNSGSLGAKTLYEYQGDDAGIRTMLEMLPSSGNAQAERGQAQQTEPHPLPALYSGNVPQYDQHSNLADMAAVTIQSQGRVGQELWWSRDNCVPRMGEFRALLCRHVVNLFGRLDNRAGGRKRILLQGKLYLDQYICSTGEQAEQQSCCVSGRVNASCGTVQTCRINQDGIVNAVESRNECRRSGDRRAQLALWEGTTGERKTQVYDLVNCGPRHQFLIRGDNGELVISHNSMGHGIDGLQDAGFTLVWYGLNWSLDLYDQFNARLRRQGQAKPVVCHRLLVNGTLDQVQASALSGKATSEAGLRRAIKEYRISKGV